MKKVLLSLLLVFFLTDTYAQNWTQITSSDLELPFSETLIKHNGHWYIGTAGGVFKTTDNGINWTLTNNNLYSAIGRLRIEGFFSSGSNLIGINRWSGVVTTTDGSTWTTATGLPSSLYMPPNIVKVGTRLVTVVYDYNLSTYNLYYSDNDGASWIKSSVVGSIHLFPNIYSDGTTAYITHTNSSEDDEFIATTTDGINLGSLPFTPSFPGKSIERVIFAGDYIIVTGEQGVFERYDLIDDGWTNLAADWTNGIGFISLTANETGKLYASIYEGNGDLGLHTSDDYGDNWSPLSVTTTIGSEFALGFYAVGNEFMASFIDEGVHYTSNSGSTIIKRNNGLQAADVQNIFASNGNLITSLFISGVYGSDDNGDNWSLWNTGLPTGDIRRIYGFLTDGSSIFANFSTSPGDDASPEKVVKSIDDGENWSALSNPAGYNNIKTIGKNSNTLFAISTDPDGLLTSSNGGDSWTDISANKPSNFTPTIVVGGGSKTFMSGLDNNNKLAVYTSNDFGSTAWNLSMDGINTSELDELDDDDDILLIESGGDNVFLQVKYSNSDNKITMWNIDTWEEKNATGFGYIDLESMAYHNGTLFASTWNSGVYISSNNGDTFTKTSGLPDGLSANTFTFEGDLAFIGSSRGIWKYSLATNLTTSTSKIQQLFSPNPAKDVITFNTTTYFVTIYSISGQPVKKAPTFNNQLSIKDLSNGVYIVVMKTINGDKISKLIIK